MNGPNGQAAMASLVVGDTEIDRCGGCRGLWFDLLEEQDLRARPRSTSVDEPWLRHPAKYVMHGEFCDRGKMLAPPELLISAHAQAVGATLVTSDNAFRHCQGFVFEDWAA